MKDKGLVRDSNIPVGLSQEKRARQHLPYQRRHSSHDTPRNSRRTEDSLHELHYQIREQPMKIFPCLIPRKPEFLPERRRSANISC